MPTPPSSLPATFAEPAQIVWGSFKNAQGRQTRFASCPPPAGVAVKGHTLLLPGFREPIEKYFEAVRDLNARGLTVWLLDWPGQGGSDRYLPKSPHKAHHLGYDEQIATLQQFVVEHVVKGKDKNQPLYLMAHSMGAHISLRWLHDHNQQNGPVTSAILTAPMVDIATAPLPKSLARQMAKIAKTGNYLENYIPTGSDWVDDNTPAPPKGPKPKNTIASDVLLSNATSDHDRIKVLPAIFAQKPFLKLGDPTYGWIYHSFQSIDILNAPGYLEAIKTPIMMEISGRERVVNHAACIKAADRLPNCERLDIADAKHEIWMERDQLRSAFFKAVDRFLQHGPQIGPSAPKTPSNPAP